MRKTRFFKLLLLIFECINFFFLALTIVLRGIGQSGLPHIAFASASALFPLMALFIWLDTERFKTYLPLFTAGKCIGVFSILVWSIICGNVRIISVLLGTADIESYLLYSYIFSMVVSIYIGRDKNPSGEIISEEKKLEVE